MKSYVLSQYSYGGVDKNIIIRAKDDNDCIDKIINNYHIFENYIEQAISITDWNRGGLFNLVNPPNPAIYKSDQDIEDRKSIIQHWKSQTNSSNKIKKLATKYQSTLLKWLNVSDNDEHYGMTLIICENIVK